MSSTGQETSANTAVDSQSSVEAGTLGFSNAASVQSIFAASPIHLGELANVEDVYFNGGDVGGESIDGFNGTVIGGHGFSEEVNLNYANSPDMLLADAGTPGGAPASAYVPNPTSPGGIIGTTNDNPAAKPAPPDSFKNMNGLGGTTGGGPSMVDAAGIPITPTSTAAQISISQKSYSKGESSWTASQKLDHQTPVDPNGNA